MSVLLVMFQWVGSVPSVDLLAKLAQEVQIIAILVMVPETQSLFTNRDVMLSVLMAQHQTQPTKPA